MPTLEELMMKGRKASTHGRWPRAVIDPSEWRAAAIRLSEAQLTLMGLWADGEQVNMALLDESIGEIGILSLDCPDRHYPSVGEWHPPALRLERAVRDLFGLEASGSPDLRPWLDHGRWGTRQPLGSPEEASAEGGPYAFLPAEGEGLHEVAVGPVHAGIIEPGHFRFTVNGETIVRLEQRFGYTHKAIETLMSGADIGRAAQLAGRVSGDSTVAYALSFARAVEDALGIEAPARAQWLRALCGELERLANHLGDIGAVCNDASFALMHAHCGILRERVLRTAHSCFGHRLMRDCIIPGGLVRDIDPVGPTIVQELVDEVSRRFPQLVELYDNTTSLQDRTVGAGVLTPVLARQYGAGGYVGRASARAFDTRRMLVYPPYDKLSFEVPVLHTGDVDARIWLRIREVEQSLSLIEQILKGMPDGSVHEEPQFAAEPREGLAVVEGFRGDILVWLRLSAEGTIMRCHLRDPSWFQWPLLETAIQDDIIADFPLCNKSFNCSYSGHDL